jgi:F-type H+-transporting ATPase subunit a
MADPVLHIKDSFYFEVPKLLYPHEYSSRKQFPNVWISLDPEYQQWEAERLYRELHARNADLPSQEKTFSDWQHWVHADHANFAKPLRVFLSEKYDAQVAAFNAWRDAEIATARQKAAQGEKNAVAEARALKFDDYLTHLESKPTADRDYLPFWRWRHDHAGEFAAAQGTQRDNIKEWKADEHVAEWSPAKISKYNGHLSGKVLIPQPLGSLRNLYEGESGFVISKYLLIEIVVGLILIVLFSQLAKRIAHGQPAKGLFANLLEVFLVFIRDQIAKPVFGGHGHGHDEHAEGHAAGHDGDGHGHGHAEHANGHAAHGGGHSAHAAASSAHHHDDPTTRFVPLLWTIFFFVLGCNLMGMVPWAGAPTASFSVTLSLAAVILLTGTAAGMMQFGVLGFFMNQIPGMDLPWYMAIVLKPMILLIELLGLMIKHLVLAIRLLANMVAGHLVLLGVMGLAFGAEAALKFTAPDAQGWQWYVTAAIAVLGSAAFSVLELFVAFLQAYIFTFLSALFIGASIHKH